MSSCGLVSRMVIVAFLCAVFGRTIAHVLSVMGDQPINVPLCATGLAFLGFSDAPVYFMTKTRRSNSNLFTGTSYAFGATGAHLFAVSHDIGHLEYMLTAGLLVIVTYLSIDDQIQQMETAQGNTP